MKYTARLRAHCGYTTGQFPVHIIPGGDAPIVSGSYGGFYTHGGTPIKHPSAYRKVGWSNMYYQHSTIRLTVGFDWVRQHMPDAAIEFMRTRTGAKKHRIRVYQPKQHKFLRKITEVSKHEV